MWQQLPPSCHSGLKYLTTGTGSEPSMANTLFLSIARTGYNATPNYYQTRQESTSLPQRVPFRLAGRHCDVRSGASQICVCTGGQILTHGASMHSHRRHKHTLRNRYTGMLTRDAATCMQVPTRIHTPAPQSEGRGCIVSACPPIPSSCHVIKPDQHL